MSLTCGIDVGGSKITGGVVDVDGRVFEQMTVESPAQDVGALVEAIAGVVIDLASRHDVAGVGIGAAAYVDKRRAHVLFAPNLAWRDLDLKAETQARVRLPVVIENDANAAAWGEFVFGAGRDVDDLVLVTVGTGVGGGIVLDGKLHRGAFGIAAEVGHLRLVPHGRPCGCGNNGCLESYGSGTALVGAARAAAGTGSTSARDLLDRAGGDVAEITGPLITEAARDGDRFALELLADLGSRLGEGIASLAAVLDPAVVAIGGGVSAAGDLLLDPIREAFETHRTGRGHHPGAAIRLAELGGRSGLLGAADLARRA